MFIGPKEVSEESCRPYIVAEVASTHEGDPELAKAVAQAAIEAGADAVKFQIFRTEELFTRDHKDYESARQVELSPEAWLDVLAFVKSLGGTVMADVDDEVCMRIALEGGVDALKVRSSNISNQRMLKTFASADKPILLATGASTTHEIARALEVLESSGAKEILLIHGFQAFPTKAEDCRLREIGFLRERFGKPVGYADHADGGSYLAFALPIAAISAGAVLIEKHITLVREQHGEDWHSSLNPPEWKRMVEELAEVWQALGKADQGLSDAEKEYRRLFKKSIVSRRRISRGEVVEEEMLAFKRAGCVGLHPDKVHGIIGKRAHADISEDQPLQADMFEDWL